MFGGKIMDNFMDKLAQKLNAQEMIKANAAAEAAQMDKMQSQIADYDEAFQEIRKLGLKQAEAADNLNQLITESAQKLDELTEESLAKIEAIQLQDKSEELEKKLQENKKEIEELLKKTEEYVHTEDVKVYRNVEAVIVEQTAKQTETLLNTQNGMNRKITAILVFSILSFAGIAVNLIFQILDLLNFKLF